MFKIYDGRNAFYQWDIDRKLIVNDKTINQVHFCNKTAECSLVVEVYTEDGLRVANVPNVLLTTDWRINVYGYDANYTKHCDTFDVIKRSKPEDYIYTENEVNTYTQLIERIDEIEENGISQEAIDAAVGNYLEENPIETGATEEEVAQINKNTADIQEIQSKGYATEKYVDDAIAAIPEVDLTPYATKKYVDDAVSNIDIPDVDLSNYATKEDTKKLADDIRANWQAIEKNTLDIKNIQEAGYQTAAEVETAITNALDAIGVAEEGAY